MLRFVLPGISLALYVVAFVSPAYITDRPDDNYPGFYCLLFGGLGLTIGVKPFLAWLANGPYFILILRSLFAKKMHIIDVLICIPMIALAPSAFSVDRLMRDEGGTIEPVLYGWGMYVWMSSLALLAIGVIVRRLRNQ